jgi:hypothetical protein
MLLALLACQSNPSDKDSGGVDSGLDSGTDTDTNVVEDDGWTSPREYELRISDVVPPDLSLEMDKDAVAELLGSVAEDIVLLELDPGPLLVNTLDTVKVACGTDWQRNASNPNHDCSKTALGRTFVGSDGTWKTSAEYSLVRVLTMTPANSVVDGTSISGLQEMADFLGIGGGFSQILSETLKIGITEEFLDTDIVVLAMKENLLGSHPYFETTDLMSVTLADALSDLETLGTKMGPVGDHPGVIDPSYPVHGEVFTDAFRMKVTASSNMRVVDGVDLSVDKDYVAVIADTTGPTYDDTLEFDFYDPDRFDLVGLAATPVVDLRFNVYEAPDFIDSCVDDSACQGNLPGSPRDSSSVWALDPWELETIVAYGGTLKYGSLSNYLSYLFGASTINVGQDGDPLGWSRFYTLFSLGSPPGDQYVWELINEVAQVALHDTPYTTFAEGDADVSFTVEDIEVGITGAEVKDKVRPFLEEQKGELADYLLGDYQKYNGDVDFTWRRQDDGEAALHFVTESELRPDLTWRWDTPGFFADEALATRLSTNNGTHEVYEPQQGESVVYVEDSEGVVYRLKLLRDGDDLIVLASTRSP